MPPTEPTPANRPVRVTVATVVFNGREHIARTLDSVLTQDQPGLEVLVIDGQSTDGTQDLVRRYGDAIHQFVSEPDRGVYDAMNKAVELARGEFILFMNCGDVFASSTAVSSLLAHARAGEEAVLFGAWVRQGGTGGDQACRPDLGRGLFNHQALAYSRSIHRWHGPYAVVPRLTTADYLFFATLMRTGRVACKVVDVSVAMIDVNGLSAGLQTFSQKQAIDYLCGNISRTRLLAMLALHPAYHRLKKLLSWAR